jgi:MFS-type transporter involved in bile tolerance (Atg22 family)
MPAIDSPAPASQPQPGVRLDAPGERAYRRRILAWAWYDWVDHACITTTASTFFPPYFVAIGTPALLAPVIGTYADLTGRRKRLLVVATAYGAALGLSSAVLIATLLMTRFVAFPYALIYGRIPDPDSWEPRSRGLWGGGGWPGSHGGSTQSAPSCRDWRSTS